MHTLESRFLYSENPSGWQFPVSTQSAFAICLRFTRSAVRFLFGGFSSTTGYVPGNEALVFRRERRSTFGLIISRGRCFVVIRATQVCLAANPSKPLGFGSKRTRQWLSAPFCPRTMRHRICSTSSVPVKVPVSNFDCETILHLILSLSREKLHMTPIFIGFPVEKAVKKL
jgi:hypothetical protein